METKAYKHKTNGSIMTYRDGCMKIENLVIEGHPNLEYWDEVKKFKLIENPNGIWNDDGIAWKIGKIVHLDNIFNGHPFSHWYEGQEKYFEPFIKEILFTTSDGVDIFEGDNIFTVCDNFEIWFTSFATKENTQQIEGRAFSTYESAQKYIEKHKSYTTEDGGVIKEGDTFYIYDDVKFKCVETCYEHHKNSKYDGKRFKNKETVEKLIRENKPQYSLKDIKDSFNKVICRGIIYAQVKFEVLSNLEDGRNLE